MVHPPSPDVHHSHKGPGVNVLNSTEYTLHDSECMILTTGKLVIGLSRSYWVLSDLLLQSMHLIITKLIGRIWMSVLAVT
jgi:hypothetical protein